MQKDCDVAVWIDLQFTISDGLVWYKSRNGAFLTRGDENGLVAWKYFMRIVVISSVAWVKSRDNCITGTQ